MNVTIFNKTYALRESIKDQLKYESCLNIAIPVECNVDRFKLSAIYHDLMYELWNGVYMNIKDQGYSRINTELYKKWQ